MLILWAKRQRRAEAYNAGDVVALTSLTEGFPFSIIEAMACGKPIVSTDVGGVKEALEECGLLVKSRHPKEFSEALVNILTNTELRLKLSKNAFERAKVIFSRDAIVRQYDEEYEQLLKRRSLVDYVVQNKNVRFQLSREMSGN